MKRLLAIAFLSVALTLINPARGWAWDGKWTKAKSGNAEDLFDDPGRSQGKAGTDPPQKFWMAGPRDYVDVDPEELSDYFDRKNKDYTPYALVRVEQTLHYQNLHLPKGYYLIKPGDGMDGSIKANIETLDDYGPKPPQAVPPVTTSPLPPLETEVETEIENTENPPAALPPTSLPTRSRPQGLSARVPVYQTLVIIRQGRVVGVVPVHRMSTYRPTQKQKIPRHALAWVEWEERRPILKFYDKKWVYETEFQ
ncbi:hypothetical protein [Vampirovibrio sp.]|uniref:hypothetical protein n=1 Tax=Vampirovibrio sp. TaxID=2717857 RepID=UPI0035946B0C